MKLFIRVTNKKTAIHMEIVKYNQTEPCIIYVTVLQDGYYYNLKFFYIMNTN